MVAAVDGPQVFPGIQFDGRGTLDARRVHVVRVFDASRRHGHRGFGAVVATPWLPELTSAGAKTKRPAIAGEPRNLDGLVAERPPCRNHALSVSRMSSGLAT